MSYKKRPFLSDKSYLRILYEIRRVVNSTNFYPESWKFTNNIGTNCGLCSKNIFDRTKNRTYFKQQCPFDMRKIDINDSMIKGCFNHCYIFQINDYEKQGKFDIDRMRKMVDDKIRIATNVFFLKQSRVHYRNFLFKYCEPINREKIYLE
ncbi:MAG: hypothetical protein ACW98D_18435 [Promethearchaeota archaeon]|jgi:hypothetical protein